MNRPSRNLAASLLAAPLMAGPLMAALPAQAESLLPSGLEVTPHDVLIEQQPGGERWLVLRYLAPGIAGGALTYAAVAADLDQLCAEEGLARAAAAGGGFAQVVIVLMDLPVPRGSADPEATQFIGAYVPQAGECLWD